MVPVPLPPHASDSGEALPDLRLLGPLLESLTFLHTLNDDDSICRLLEGTAQALPGCAAARLALHAPCPLAMTPSPTVEESSPADEQTFLLATSELAFGRLFIAPFDRVRFAESASALHTYLRLAAQILQSRSGAVERGPHSACACLLGDPQVQQRLFRDCPDPLALKSAELAYDPLNPTFCRLLGITSSQAVGKTDVDLMAPDQALQWRKGDLEALSGRRPVAREETLTTPAGEYCFSVSRTPLVDGDGQPKAVLLHLRDLTDRRRAEDALRDSERRFRILADFTHDWEYWIDPAGRFQYVSPSCLDICGFAPEEFYADPDRILRMCHPDDRSRLAGHVAAMLQSHEKGAIDFRIIDAQGQERWISHHCQAVLGENGEFLGRRASNRDVTERIQAMQALRENEMKIQQILHAVPGAIFQYAQGLDGRDRFLFIGPAIEALTGLKAPDVLQDASRLWALSCDEDGQALRRQMLRCAQAGARWEKDIRIQTLDGQTRWLQMSATAEAMTAYNSHLWTGILTDITALRESQEDRRRLLENALQSQKMESMGVMASGVAHDFNNLLMVILGHADLCIDDLPVNSPIREDLMEIDRAAQRAAELAGQMLQYSGHSYLELASLDLSEMVRKAEPLLRAAMAANAILTCEPARTPVPVVGDCEQIRQALIHLVINASEALDDICGQVTVTSGLMEVDGDFMARVFLSNDIVPGVYGFLQVSDTGQGIEEGVIPRLFDPFFSTKFPGRGLGLAAAFGIVKGHGGAIAIASSPGEGAVFTILLPQRPAPAEQPNPPDSAQEVEVEGPLPGELGADRSLGEGRTALLVEDEEAIRRLSAYMLTHLGFQVIAVEDGLRAVETFQERACEIDLVLLDFYMPVLDGRETLQALRRIRPDTPVVMMSGYSERDIRQRMNVENLSAFVQKPFSLGRLVQTIASLPQFQQ